jgi:deoxyribodipyrimidine photolyase-like uncharacterized protein
MKQGEPLLFHSHVSTLINCGLLDPRECCEKAEQAYRDGKAPLNAVEGFIRQIIGWREFIRGVYWLKMPDYGTAMRWRRRGPCRAFSGPARPDELPRTVHRKPGPTPMPIISSG